MRSGSSRSGGAPSQLTATFLAELLKSGDLQRHIVKTLQPAYASRYHVMTAAIEEHLVPLGLTLAPTSREVVGGYFLWLSLPASLRASDVAARAQAEENVIIAPGPLFGVSGDSKPDDFGQGIRLCFSWEEEGKLQEGVERLGRAIRRMQTSDVTQRPAQGIISPGNHNFH